MHRDAREGGENPPLPRNCKRVFLRLVFMGRRRQPVEMPLEPDGFGKAKGCDP
jgi:hypothetical protein